MTTEDFKNITYDSFQNIIAKLGVGSDSDNLISQSHQGFDPLTRKRLELEFAYRGSAICKNAIDIPALDMFRTGITLHGLSPEDTDKLTKTLVKLKVWEEFTNAVKWGRLYGGSLIYFLIDGQDVSTELNTKTIGLGQFKGVKSLSRWQALPSIGNFINELGPDYGLPVEYQITQDSVVSIDLPIVNHTRVSRIIPVELPYYQKAAEWYWGLSVLEPLWDRLISFDSASMGAAQLTYKAHLRTLKIPNLRQIVAMGGEPLDGLNAQIAFMRSTQSNEGITVIDGEDEFETTSYSFGGFSEVIDKFAEQVAGALQIPLTRLLGKDPGGLGNNGATGFATYYDMIANQQEYILRSPIQKMLEIASMSILGKPLPEDFTFTFNSLFEADEKSRAEVEARDTMTIISAYTSGIISLEEARAELRTKTETGKLFQTLEEGKI